VNGKETLLFEYPKGISYGAPASSAFSVHKLRTCPFMEWGLFFLVSAAKFFVWLLFAKLQKVTGSLSDKI